MSSRARESACRLATQDGRSVRVESKVEFRQQPSNQEAGAFDLPRGQHIEKKKEDLPPRHTTFATMKEVIKLIAIAAIAVLSNVVEAFKPVIMMHGVGSGAGEMSTIRRLLNQTHPGTIATSLPLYENSPDAWDHDLQTQVGGVIDAIRKLIAANPEAYKDGYHLVCKSQGALICRCVIEEMDDHKVDTFVSLAGPQAGVYGTACEFSAEIVFCLLSSHAILSDWLGLLTFRGIVFDGLKIPFFERTTANLAYLIAYNWLGQKISVANMWRDPNHLDRYESGNVFLPKYTEHANTRMKENFERLKKAVFCVGSGPSYDGGIEPWQTGAWGQWDAGQKTMLNMTQQDFYINDTFGLRTLDESERLHTTIVPGASHSDWTGNEDLIKKWVLPHCT